jgi:hypothetical protein
MPQQQVELTRWLGMRQYPFGRRENLGSGWRLDGGCTNFRTF